MEYSKQMPNKKVVANWLFANYKKTGLKAETLEPLLPQEMRLALVNSIYSKAKEGIESRMTHIMDNNKIYPLQL